MADLFGQKEVGASDLPWAMAWYGDRRTIWLPLTVKDFDDLDLFVAPKGVAFLMFTPYMLNQPFESEVVKGQYKEWAWIVRGSLPRDFALKAITPLPPGNEQILLADKARWSPQKSEELQELEKTQAGKSQPATNPPPSSPASPGGTEAPKSPPADRQDPLEQSSN